MPSPSPWYRSLDRTQWKALVASNLGWTFDGFEIFALFLTVGFALRQLLDAAEYSAIPQYAGYILACTVFGWATGGVIGGIIADYIGRKRTMMLAILAYSLTTGLSAFAWDWGSFAVLRFLVGVAHRLAETIGTAAMPPVREALGRLAAQAAMVEGMVAGMEAAGHLQDGYYVPDKHMMYAAQVLTQELYPKLIETIRGLAGGALIMLPSSERDWANPELAAIIEKTQRSPISDPQQRVHFLRLAWDALGSEFGSRHTQYEMFYAGAPFVTCAHSYRTYDWSAAEALVQKMLED